MRGNDVMGIDSFFLRWTGLVSFSFFAICFTHRTFILGGKSRHIPLLFLMDQSTKGSMEA